MTSWFSLSLGRRVHSHGCSAPWRARYFSCWHANSWHSSEMVTRLALRLPFLTVNTIALHGNSPVESQFEPMYRFMVSLFETLKQYLDGRRLRSRRSTRHRAKTIRRVGGNTQHRRLSEEH